MNLPKAKSENIVVQNLDGETLVYDLTTNQAFCLNETAAHVFEACGGAIDFEQLKEKYHYTDEIVFLALDRLKKENLLADEAYVSPFAGMNRREVIKRVGLASMIALPVISALVAPHPAHAASVSCRTNVCLAPGTDTCAGCTGKTITYTIYSSTNTGCTSPVASNSLLCNGTAQVSNTDRKITSAV